jgi:hypothetical protein
MCATGAEKQTGGLKRKVRNRTRSVNKHVLAIALAGRHKRVEGEERRKKHYRNTRSAERRKLEKSRWFRKAQAWRTGCEGRISVIKRRHGLSRCRYRGLEGMKRWVGLGVMADNLINIGTALAVAHV